LLPASETCYDAGIDDVPTQTECFGSAAAALGLSSSGATYAPGLGLSCAYDPAAASAT
jgi:hypothetical protein